MEYVLADQRLRVTCLNDADRFDELEDGIFCDEWGTGIAGALHPWCGRLSLPDQDLVVLVTRNDDDRPLGLVAASQRATQREPFLLLEAAYVSPAARGRNLLQRMIAFAVLSLARRDMLPTLIAACSHSEAYRRNIGELCGRFTAASAFPDADAPAIDLGMAGTAQRIARTLRPEARYEAGSGTFYAANDRDHRFPQNRLVVLELAGAEEATIEADARRVFRERTTRRSVYAADSVPGWRGTKRPVPGVASSLAPSQISRPRR